MHRYPLHRRSLPSRCLVWAVVLSTLVFFQCLPGLAAEAKAAKGKAKKEAKVEKPAAAKSSGGAISELPEPVLSAGGKFGESVFEGFGDVLAPVVLLKSGVVFVNPRVTLNDNDAEEYNLGAGYRHLLPKNNIILGANIYYDYRETELGAEFNQLGLGVEFLSEWVDARANYYIPDDDQEKVGEYDTETTTSSSSESWTWYDPYATGHRILQNGVYTHTRTVTTTKQHFEQYEQAMEGFDAEVGVKLPIPGVKDYADIKVFGGYYSFDANFGEKDIEGFKGRVEIHALPALYLDCEVFEDKELNGSDYFIGGRFQVPFDVANLSQGKNPFEGSSEGFKSSKKAKPFASRLTEMVMRDLHVRTDVSEWQEIVERREVDVDRSSSSEPVRATIVGHANFVDADNAGDPAENGTWEHPYDVIQEGVDNAQGDKVVYVRDAAVDYEENVVMTAGVTIWGSGCRIPANGGKSFGNGIYPTVDGMSLGPSITMANDTTVRGMRIVNTDSGGAPIMVDLPVVGLQDVSRVGVLGNDVDDLVLRCNLIENCTVGARLARAGSFRTEIIDNRFVNNEDVGLALAGTGASGTFETTVQGNEFSGNSGGGLDIEADNYDLVDIGLFDNAANDNVAYGIYVHATDDDVIRMDAVNTEANNNPSDGFANELYANESCEANFTDTTANDNGYGFWANVYGYDGDAILRVNGAQANNNSQDGLRFGVEARGAGSLAYGRFEHIVANNNSYGGLYADNRSYEGNASLTVDDAVANNTEAGCGIMAYNYAFDNNADGFGGNAVMRIEDVKANDNGYCSGLYAENQSYEGNASLTILNVEANNNDNGIEAHNYALDNNADGFGGNAVMRIEDVEANNGSGIVAQNRSYEGNASLTVDDAVANGNDNEAGCGILACNYAYNVDGDGFGGNAVMRVSDITANNNYLHGLSVDNQSYEGDATLTILNVEANNNDNGYGIVAWCNYAYDNNADGFGGNATAVIDGVEALNNYYSGVFVQNESAEGNASLTVDDAVANNNGDAGGGIYDGLALYNRADDNDGDGFGGRADTKITDTTARWNDGDGIYLENSSQTSGARVAIFNVTATGNGDNGIEVSSFAGGGDSIITGRTVHVNSNTGIDMEASTEAHSGGDAIIVLRDFQRSSQNLSATAVGGGAAIIDVLP